MKANDFLRLALVFYVLGGYVVARRYAERSIKSVEPQRSVRPLIRAGSWLLLVVMPLSAITAFCVTWHESIFPLIVGSTMNVFWFYAGCLGILRNRQRYGTLTGLNRT